MSVPLRSVAFTMIAAVTGVAGVACDRDKALLELDLAAAEARLAELERASQADEIDTWAAEVDRRLPDAPRGALTASIAAFLPGAEIDGTLPEIKTGYVSTDPVEVTLPIDLQKVIALFDHVRTLGRVWQIDSVRREGKHLYVRLHGFTFSGALQKLAIDVAPNENTMFSAERDRIKDRTRRVLAEIAAKTANTDEAKIARYWRAELKRSLLGDLSGRMEKIEDDAALMLATFTEAEVVPLDWTIGIRMGRRICSIRVDTEAEKKKIIAVGGSKPGVAVDAQEKELVLKSGRVCTVGVGPAPTNMR